MSDAPGQGTVSELGRSIDLLDLIASDDEAFEADLLRNPYNLKPWLRYIHHKRNSSSLEQIALYERACLDLPGSYKLWTAYLGLRVDLLRRLNPAKHAHEYNKVNGCFNRALSNLSRMPKLWIMYLQFLSTQCKISETRRTFDRALRALPVTQHHMIWPLYRSWSRSIGGVTAAKVWKRYVTVEPDQLEYYIAVLRDNDLCNEAADAYAALLNKEDFRSLEGKSHFQIWSEFCEFILHHPRDTGKVDVEAVLRGGITRFTDQTGKLWTSLAQFYINLANFERARDIFEEGMTKAMTVRDFTQIFDTYAEFEEQIISSRMAAQSNRDKDDSELDFLMLRFEALMDRRPFLVNDVLLRQNPNNVVEWQKRIGLWAGNDEQAVNTYTAAIKTIDPKKATGPFDDLWLNFAKFYIDRDDFTSARSILGKAVNVRFNTVNELANIYCSWAELELEHDHFDNAIKLMKEATAAPKNSKVSYFDESLTPQQRLHKSSKVWMYFIDLEESIGTVEATRHLYEKVFDLRIATLQTVVNYASFLEEHQYFEDSFKVYEKGIALFGYPSAFELWNLYLTKFIKRYGGSQMERLRDLFEDALQQCPPQYQKPIFLLYADVEEDNGVPRRAMEVFSRATDSVPEKDKISIFEIYISKSKKYFGLLSSRPIYEKALHILSDNDTRKMCSQFAAMETELREIERARSVFGFGSQFADPKRYPQYWSEWHDFEVKHGSERTFKEMLRIKRSVQAQYMNDTGNLASQEINDRHNAQLQPSNDTLDPMEAAEKQMSKDLSNVQMDDPASQPSQARPAMNPDAIEMDDDL